MDEVVTKVAKGFTRPTPYKPVLTSLPQPNMISLRSERRRKKDSLKIHLPSKKSGGQESVGLSKNTLSTTICIIVQHAALSGKDGWTRLGFFANAIADLLITVAFSETAYSFWETGLSIWYSPIY
jgi:hypothetical protein